MYPLKSQLKVIITIKVLQWLGLPLFPSLLLSETTTGPSKSRCTAAAKEKNLVKRFVWHMFFIRFQHNYWIESPIVYVSYLLLYSFRLRFKLCPLSVLFSSFTTLWFRAIIFCNLFLLSQTTKTTCFLWYYYLKLCAYPPLNITLLFFPLISV